MFAALIGGASAAASAYGTFKTARATYSDAKELYSAVSDLVADSGSANPLADDEGMRMLKQPKWKMVYQLSLSSGGESNLQFEEAKTSESSRWLFCCCPGLAPLAGPVRSGDKARIFFSKSACCGAKPCDGRDSLTCGECCCCTTRMNVFAMASDNSRPESVGYIKDRSWPCPCFLRPCCPTETAMDIYDKDHKHHISVAGENHCCSCATHSLFLFPPRMIHMQSARMGVIVKPGTSGAKDKEAKEARQLLKLDEDDIGLLWPPEPEIQDKLLVTGAALMADLAHFDGAGCGRCCHS